MPKRKRSKLLCVPQPLETLDVVDLPSVLQEPTTKEEPLEELQEAQVAPKYPEIDSLQAEAETEVLEASQLEQADEEVTLNGIGELVTLRRFLRLWQAREAWDRRLVHELLCWSIGQPATQLPVHEEDFFSSLGTPAWARPAGALYRGAAATCSSAHIFAPKRRPRTAKKPRHPGKPAKETSSEGSDSEEPRTYRPNDWPEETRHFEILQRLWPNYLRFREARALQERPSPKWRSMGVESVERERSLRNLLAQAGHGFQASEWHGLLCRLLLCAHNNIQLFVQVQLPFVKRQFMGLPALDLWQQTSQFLQLTSKTSRPQAARAWVEELRKPTIALVNAAPRIFQCIFESSQADDRRTRLEEELRRVLEASGGLNCYDSVLAGLVLGYRNRFGHKVKRESLLVALAPKERRLVCRMLGVSFRAAPQDDAALLRMLQKRLQAPVQSADACECLRQDEIPEVSTLRLLLQEYLHWESFKPGPGAELSDNDFLQWLCPKLDYRSGRYQDVCRRLLREGMALEEEKSHKTFERRELTALKEYLQGMELPTDLNVTEYIYADGEQAPEPQVIVLKEDAQPAIERLGTLPVLPPLSRGSRSAASESSARRVGS